MSARTTVFCFDLDDTLVSESEYVESGLRAAGDLLDREKSGPESAAEWMVALWRRSRSSDIFQQVLARRGANPEIWLPRLKAAYREHRPVLSPRPGLLDVLGVIVSRGDRLALISDGHLGAQRRKWDALALPFSFDPVVFTDERGREYWKPNPWAYERVMGAHPDARAFVYVGDNPAKDFVAPNELGWTTVQLVDQGNLCCSGSPPAGAAAQHTIRHFSRLLEPVSTGDPLPAGDLGQRLGSTGVPARYSPRGAISLERPGARHSRRDHARYGGKKPG